MPYELDVDQGDFVEGLKKFKTRRKIRPSERAILAFDGRFCSIEAIDILVVAKATGTWPGIARFSATALAALAKFPPAGGPVIVRVDGNQLRLATLTVGCEWQPVSHTLMHLPASPDWIEALSLKYRATRAQIISAGLEPDIANAEKKLKQLVVRIGKALAPLGVSENDIRKLVETKMAEKYANAA